MEIVQKSDTSFSSSSSSSSSSYTTQKSLLLKNLLIYYKENDNLDNMLRIINGESKISLRIVDWFTTNYAKKYYTVYTLPSNKRFKVYVDYKLKLRSYSKKNFDPFCRWERINIPYKNEESTFIQTTIGQLNFFKWAFENKIITFIEENYLDIEKDMNTRNSMSKKNRGDGSSCSSASSSLSSNSSSSSSSYSTSNNQKTRKKREELSISATKTIKKEEVEIVLNFD